MPCSDQGQLLAMTAIVYRIRSTAACASIATGFLTQVLDEVLSLGTQFGNNNYSIISVQIDCPLDERVTKQYERRRRGLQKGTRMSPRDEKRKE